MLAFRGVVILNSNDYHSKLDSIISDSTKFTEKPETAKTHPIIAREQLIRKLIKEYLKSYDDKLVDCLLPSGSVPGKLYGAVKVHKKDNSARHIVSMIGAPEYNLAKFLDSIIKPYVSGTNMTDSSNDLMDKLQHFNFNQKNHLLSFDVALLFTNIPLRETIDIITQKIYSDKTCEPPITKEHFTELLSIATQGMFLYKNKLYQFIDEVAMGSPLGLTLANFFLATVETKLRAQNLGCSRKLYLGYVDDIFAIFEEKSSSKFLDVLNHQHKNLEFTMEKSIGAFPFLDVQMNINQSILGTRIWMKPTHTGVLLNFNAACPEQWKTGLILCLLKRAKKSKNNLFHRQYLLDRS